MAKKSAFCLPSAILLIIGGLNWGLVGLGALIKANLNLVNLLFGAWPTVEAIVYLLVGAAAIKVLVMMLMGRSCCGESCDK